MSTPMDNPELARFYQSLLQEIRAIQLSEEEGGTLEQLFTQLAVNLLAESGETENVRVIYDERSLGTKNQHKINGYSIADNYETIDLFITVFKNSDGLTRITRDETETARKRIVNFLGKAIYKDYVSELEESSAIFDFAHTLANSEELKESLARINVIILTDGIYNGESISSENKFGYPIFFRVVDIDYLYNITEKSHIPIEIDFKNEYAEIPCIPTPLKSDQYESYLAIMPGRVLAGIYERWGSRLLEQNVRSFLQFTGKINKGIRTTIIEEPHMFLAFNNGIAATAEDLVVEKSATGEGHVISKAKDFQIVNGGQTTASIYHTLKKDRPPGADNIFVQVKISVIKAENKFSAIVSKISEYSNTQNKVSFSDLSSNNPYHIALEKLSRVIVTPYVSEQSSQSSWFYERARGQYKNARLKEGFTKTRQKAFDLKNSRTQLFSKEDLAKYVNVYQEVFEGKKLVVGPHYVVRGSQKNYSQFISYNLPDIKKVDSIYYEDLIAKAILFRTAEKIYGVKPNAIGDLRYVTVPYSIALLNHRIEGRLDLYKIWKNQAISEGLRVLLYDLMIQVEGYIKTNAPGSLYGEWAKKEECWTSVKSHPFNIDGNSIQKDFQNPGSYTQRRRISEEEAEDSQAVADMEKIMAISGAVWYKIEDWGRATGALTVQQQNTAWNLGGKLKNGGNLSEYEISAGIKMLDIVIENAFEILFDSEEAAAGPTDKTEITLDLIKRMTEWDRKNKRLKPQYFQFMHNLVAGKTPLTEQAKKIVALNLEVLKKQGFK